MKKLIVTSLLSLFACTSFAEEIDRSTYEEFRRSVKKEEFLQNYINTRFNLKNSKCIEPPKFVQLEDSAFFLYVQMSCKNWGDDLHIMMPKFNNATAVVKTCKEGSRGKDGVKCKDRLN